MYLKIENLRDFVKHFDVVANCRPTRVLNVNLRPRFLNVLLETTVGLRSWKS